jgi:hypothetical protein
MNTIVLWLIAIALLPIVMVMLNELVIRKSADAKRSWLTGPQIISASLIVTAAAASVVYEALFAHGLTQTAALFVGIPTVLALATLFVPASSAYGVAVKSVTIGLLISLLFLKEGVLCVLMSAPLFYVIALLVGAGAEGLGDPDNRGRYFSSIVILAAIGPMSLEGVTPTTTVPRHVVVQETRIVNAAAASIETAIQQQPRFDRALPRLLTIGFPRPTSTQIDGDAWRIRMRGGEMRLNGMEPRAGDLVLLRDGRGDNFISWRAASDDSHMTHFLNWEASRVEWTAIDSTTTRVTWTLQYRRGLDPAWYFGPMERYAMTLAAGYLIEAVATP